MNEWMNDSMNCCFSDTQNIDKKRKKEKKPGSIKKKNAKV